jgi:hypothetical protein
MTMLWDRGAARRPPPNGPTPARLPDNARAQAHYRHSFWRSRQHGWLALATLAPGFVSGHPLGLIAGLALYALGLLFLPDLPFVRRAIDRQSALARQADAEAKRTEWLADQKVLLADLASERADRHAEFLALCDDIETSMPAQVGQFDPGASRATLDALTHTNLRLLAAEQTIDSYLLTEGRDDLEGQRTDLEADIQRLVQEIEAMRRMTPRPPLLNGKERLCTSWLERREALHQRAVYLEQARMKYCHLRAEQARLRDQVKLIRATALATKDTDVLSGQLDTGIEQLTQINAWLAEFSETDSLAKTADSGRGR